MEKHSCYECRWECLDGCSIRHDDNGNREPVYDEPVACEDFEWKKCKYYKPHMDILLEYCKCLYKLEGCAAGGPLHILLDDDNYDDDSIRFCTKECLEHPEHAGSELGALICRRYWKMSMEERSVFDWYWCGHKFDCKCNSCEECELLHNDDY